VRTFGKSLFAQIIGASRPTLDHWLARGYIKPTSHNAAGHAMFSDADVAAFRASPVGRRQYFRCLNKLRRRAAELQGKDGVRELKRREKASSRAARKVTN
jgi:DNA-binding transcriptional MerR regulator